MRIIDPGLMTTVQDRGRFGYQKDGVTPGGAMDRIALTVANSLVGNDESAAALEMTIAGPSIEFLQDELIAVCGADLSAEMANIRLPTWRAIYVRSASVLSFGEARWGCRAYLAVAGGINVPAVMESRSTNPRAGIGGIDGRALRAGDEIPTHLHRPGDPIASRAAAGGGPMPFALSERFVDEAEATSLYGRSESVRVLPGPHFELFDERDRRSFFDHAFEVSPRSDRMGYRLTGPVLDSSQRAELVSSAVLMGTVQVPGGGEPILLMADRQTTGGYPTIAQVTTADLPTIAQLKPGDEIRFEMVTLDQAHAALRAQRDKLEAVKGKVIRDAPGRP
jgi:antagonist of KipI